MASLIALSGCGGSDHQPTDRASDAVPVQGVVASGPAGMPEEFAICQSCHTTQRGQNSVGPSLWGVVGRPAGTLPGYTYSPAVKRLHFRWDAAHLDTWLSNPMAIAPGTKMTFPGYADPAQRRAVIAYLGTLH